MIFYFLVLLLFAVVSCKFYKYPNIDYLDKNNTDTIKGFFLILVFLSHITGYYNFNSEYDRLYFAIRNLMGQGIVTFFLFCSGYGIMEAIKKDISYIYKILKNRFCKTLLHFDIAVTIFLFVNLLLGYNVLFENYIFSLFAWTGIGNSVWYIFCILYLYLITYLIFKIIVQRKGRINYNQAILVLFLFCILYVCVISKYRELYWYDTIFCYPFGMFYSLYKKQLFDLLCKKKNVLIFAIIISAFVFLIYNLKSFLIIKFIYNIVFVSIILVLMMYIKCNNRLLMYIGQNLFGFYILQRIPMFVLQDLNLINNKYIYVAIVFLLLFPVNYIFNKIIKAIDLKIF